ncbi:hypothetical protein COU57_02210 [Candidatus Pacearchaeota archaeon CG10_big_fil_rev_8_21_14_0_10_32_14]|nr:MAG: hypothetical protein COU57_02210 [Candidatus Pacearchaeota archaeon CG10_big_fil_rev_8_21_14_0_10_32_14]
MKKRVANKKLVRKGSSSRSLPKNEKGILGLYKQSWRYLVESRRFILYSVIIFIIFILIGFFVPVPKEVETKLLEFLKELAKETEGMNALQLTAYIFWNNLKSSFFGMIFGVGLGIFPLITAGVNGYVVGYVSMIVSEKSSILELWRLLPHGIFELPAVFISLGLGLRMGMFIFNEHKIESLLYYLKNSLIVFFLIVLPLLIIAAIIEGLLISLI